MIASLIKKNFTEDLQIIFPISIALGLLTIILNQYILYVCILPPVILMAFLYGKRFLYGYIIVTLFTLVGDVSGALRIYIQLTDFLLLTILFLEQYGFEWRSYPRIPGSIKFFLFVFYLAMILSSAMSRYPSASVPLIIQQTIFFVILYLLFSLIRDEKDVKVYILSILISSIILTASTLADFIQNGFILANLTSSVGRISGLIANVNALTNYYIISLPFIIISFYLKGKYFNKKLSFLVLIYFIAGLIITISRTAVIGVLLSTAFILFTLKKKYFYYLLTTIAVLLASLVLYEPFNEFITMLLRVEEGMSNRDHLWTLSANIIRDNPVFGIGAGSYKYEIFNYFPVLLNSWPGEVIINLHGVTGGANVSHNFFLRSYSDLGILGLISALLIPAVFFRIGIRTIRCYKSGDRKTYFIILALFASGAAMFLRSVVDDIGILTYGWIAADLPLWLIFSCLVYYYNMCLNNKEINLINKIPD